MLSTRCIPFIICAGALLCGSGVPLQAGERKGVMLLVQGAGPAPSNKAAEACWGTLNTGSSKGPEWSGFVGNLVYRGWKFGGIFRSKSEQVTPADLDAQGASHEPADFYLLASSVASQTDGLESRAREISTAVAAVRQLRPNQPIRLVCYSAGGIAARLWMQGAIKNHPYEEGMVGHLITVATPHLGIGGLVAVATRTWDRYMVLAPDAKLLKRINGELHLPHDVRYTAIVIQGTGNGVLDSGQAYEPFVRLSAEELGRLPPLMRQGHDGAVHALSAQLQLTPAAARFENDTNRPVEVVFHQHPRFYGASVKDPLIHTAALQDKAFWETLHSVLNTPPVAAPPDHSGSGVATRTDWTEQIALHLAATQVQRRHITGRLATPQLTQREDVDAPTGQQRVRWKCRCNVEVPRLFRSAERRTYDVQGAFTLTFDRFGRPSALSEVVLEIAVVQGD